MTITELIRAAYPFAHTLWEEIEGSLFVRENHDAIMAGTVRLPPAGDITAHCPSQWDKGAPTQEEIDAMKRQQRDLETRIAAAEAKQPEPV